MNAADPPLGRLLHAAGLLAGSGNDLVGFGTAGFKLILGVSLLGENPVHRLPYRRRAF